VSLPALTGPLWERDLEDVALLASEAVSVSAAGAIEMKPEGKEAFRTCFFFCEGLVEEFWLWVELNAYV